MRTNSCRAEWDGVLCGDEWGCARVESPCSSVTNLSVSLSLSFNNHLSTWTWVSRYQDVSILEFIGAKDD